MCRQVRWGVHASQDRIAIPVGVKEDVTDLSGTPWSPFCGGAGAQLRMRGAILRGGAPLGPLARIVVLAFQKLIRASQVCGNIASLRRAGISFPQSS